MGVLYTLTRLFASMIADVFFKDVTIVGKENVPKTGPVIFCGTHANQFLDAMIMVKSIEREVGFIIAAKSYRRPLIGTLSKGAKSIPVERPQDLAKAGTGTISEVNETTLKGKDTKFTEELKPGDILKVKDIIAEIRVKQVNSDTEITYDADQIVIKTNMKAGFKIIPKIDQSKMYESVWHRLRTGGTVGIFPEGGSHDNTQMLPLKAGVCIMALGAMLEENTAPVKIVPCGLNYYRADRFRSKVVIEFGHPYEVPRKLVDTYKKSKKDAIAKLLSEIERRMLAVRISAPTYSELTSLFLVRKLYTPPKANLSPEEEYMFNHILAQGYSEMKDDTKIKGFLDSVNQYHRSLRKLRLDDSTVKRISSNKWKDIQSFFYSLFMFIVTGLIGFPGFLLNGSLALLIVFMSEKERRKALASSSVKVKGMDVVASYKVMCALVIFPTAFTLFTIIFRLLISYFLNIQGTLLNLLTLYFFMVWPLYSYAMVLATDKAYNYYKNIKARFVLILFKSKVRDLKRARKELVVRVTNFVETNFQDILNKIDKKYQSEPVSPDTSMVDLELERENTLPAEEALDQAFAILEEIGI